jgi:hypothetical protein
MELVLKYLPYYIINCKNKPDRKIHVIDELKKAGIEDYIIVEGVEHEQGHIGCSLSHKKVIQLAEKNGHEQFVILEDDVSFNLEQINKIFGLPEDTDGIYTGISKYGLSSKRSDEVVEIYPQITKKEHLDNNFTKLDGMLSTHGICYLTKRFADEMKVVIDDAIKYNIPHDVLIAARQKSFNIYGMRRPLVYQDYRVGGVEFATNFNI